MAEETNNTAEIKRLTETLNKYFTTLNKTGAGTKEQKAYMQMVRDTITQLRKQKEATGISEAQLKKLNEQILDAEESLDKFNKVLEEVDKAEKERERRRKDLADKRIKLEKDVMSATFKFGDATTKNADNLSYFASAFKEVPVLGPGFGLLAGSLDYTIEQYKSLSASGADFGKSMIGMRMAAQSAQMPLEDYIRLIKQNNEVLAGLFGTTNRGARELGRLSDTVRKNAGPQLAELGFGFDEINQFTTTYLSRQRAAGAQDYKNDLMATAAVTGYAKQLKTLSDLTGLHVENLDKEVQARKTDSVFQSYLASLAPDQRTSAEGLISSLSLIDKRLGEFGKEVIATGVPISDFNQQFGGVNGELLQILREFRESGAVDAPGTLSRLSKAADGLATKFGPAQLAGGISETQDIIFALRNRAGDAQKVLADMNKAMDPATKQMIQLQDSTKRLKSAFEGVQTSFLQSLGPAVAGLLNGQANLPGMLEKLNKFMQENPKITAAAYLAAMGTFAVAQYARDVSVVTAGVVAANKITAAGDLIKTVGGSLAGIAKYVGMLGVATTVGSDAYSAVTATNKKDQNKSSNKLFGGVAATLATLALLGTGPLGWGVAALAAMAGSELGGNYLPDMFKDGGGPVKAGQSYIVGERRPELFTPSTSGTISPMIMKKTADGVETQPTGSDSNQVAQINGLVNTLNNTMGAMNETLRKSEKHLNTLIEVGLMQVDKATELKNSVAQLDYAIVK
jgi:hypothetical protein